MAKPARRIEPKGGGRYLANGLSNPWVDCYCAIARKPGHKLLDGHCRVGSSSSRTGKVKGGNKRK